MVARVASACLLAACCVQVAAGRQQDQSTPTFRSGIELVQLDVIVTTDDGHIVGDLTADDFEIREDGQLQRIAAFSLVDIPLTSADPPPHAAGSFEPDVRRNDGPEGRLYVFVLDEVSASSALRTRHHLRQFVDDHFGANDVGAVVLLGRGPRNQSQGFTSSRRLLLAAIDSFTGGFPQEPDSAAPAPPAQQGADTGQDEAEGELAELLPLPPGGPPPTARLQAAYDAAARMTALRDLMRFMANIPDRRKVMLFVSEGIGVNMFNVVDAPGTTLTYAGDIAREAMRAALRNNVAIYPIDPRGLSQSGGGGETNDPPGSLLAEQESLRALAYVTGGRALVGTNLFERGFEQMVLESSTYYLLGFYPTNDRRDGGYRRIDVRVRRPGLTVRARNGYFAPTRPTPRTASDGGALAALDSALGSPLPVSGVPMRLVATPYRSERNRASVAVAVELDASGLDLDADRTGRIDLAYAVIDAAGRVRQRQRADVSLRLQQRTAEAVARSGFRILLGPELGPGVYQLRVAAATSRGRAGSVITDVEVPDFSKPPLAMSGVSITSLLTDSVQTASIQDPLRGRLPRPVTARREFLPTDTLFVYTELYDNIRPDPPHSVRLLVELRAEDGRIAWTNAVRRSSSELKGQRGGGFQFVTELPLDGIALGRYIVHVEATADVRDSPTVTRQVLISVGPTPLPGEVPTRAAATPERPAATWAASGIRSLGPILETRSSDGR